MKSDKSEIKNKNAKSGHDQKQEEMKTREDDPAEERSW